MLIIEVRGVINVAGDWKIGCKRTFEAESTLGYKK